MARLLSGAEPQVQVPVSRVVDLASHFQVQICSRPSEPPNSKLPPRTDCGMLVVGAETGAGELAEGPEEPCFWEEGAC